MGASFSASRGVLLPKLWSWN